MLGPRLDLGVRGQGGNAGRDRAGWLAGARQLDQSDGVSFVRDGAVVHNPERRVAAGNGNLRVLFDGVPSPLVSATMNRASAVVPCAVAGRPSTQVQGGFTAVWSNPPILPGVCAPPSPFPVAPY